jgi:hypothetical protein
VRTAANVAAAAPVGRKCSPVGRCARPVTFFNGAPVYDGSVVGIAGDVAYGQLVMLGIGPEGHQPVVYHALCPVDGVRQLIAELQDVAAAAAEHHPPHHDCDCGPT